MKSGTKVASPVSVHRGTRQLHVGIDATTWANDRGFGRFTRELVAALLRRPSGFRYTLVFDRVPEDIPPGVNVVTAPTNRSLTEAAVGTHSRSLGDLWRLGGAVRRTGFDVFFFPAVYSYFPVLSRVPCVVCYHDTTAERFPQLLFPGRLNRWFWIAKTSLARWQTTRAMTVSETSARDLGRIFGMDRERIDVVTEGAAPVFGVLGNSQQVLAMRDRVGIPSGARLLVYVGGLNPHKNLMGLLRAMPRALAAHPELHLAIVGDVSGKGFWDNVSELKEHVRTHVLLQEHVTFTGYLDDPSLVELLNGAEALVFPSLWEGFGLPAVEAMCCGVPVLASRRGSLPEIVGDAGLFFEPEDPSSIAECLTHFLDDPVLRSKLAEASLNRGRRFSWDRAAELAEASFERCYYGDRQPEAD